VALLEVLKERNWSGELKSRDPEIAAQTAAGNDAVNLSQERIVALAEQLMETEGVESITMRRLASELEVTPMALYHHVPNKQALLALVGNAVLTTVGFPGPEAGPWYERLRLENLAVYQALNKYPGLGQHHLSANHFSPSGVQKTQKTIDLLMEAGFDEDESLAAVYLTLTYMGGDFLSKGGSHRDHAQPVFALGEDGQVATHPIIGSQHQISQTQAFLRGLDTIIAGLRAQLAAKKALIPNNM
jgi:AcrR family transcriptional regulator